MPLTNVQRVFYRAQVARALSDTAATPFEDWFTELAQRRWGTDFEPVRAQGRSGDLKCDGHRLSTGTIFQCYAPRRLENRALTAKIANDFSGALGCWGGRMKAWHLVINERAGLCAEAKQQTDALRAKHAHVDIRTMGPIEIERLALELNAEQLGDLFGYVMDAAEARSTRITFKDIEDVVATLEGSDPVPSLAPLSVPAENKAEHNGFEPEIRELIRSGERLAPRVAQFFNETGRVELGERLATRLAENYRSMKDAGHDPAQIFFVFVDMCGGLDRPPQGRAALLAVLSYYFNSCNIFENAPEAAT